MRKVDAPGLVLSDSRALQPYTASDQTHSPAAHAAGNKKRRHSEGDNSMTPSREHLDVVMNVVGNEAALTALAHDNPIHRSWLRCYNDYGLDPAGRQRMRVESSGALRERHARHAEYLHTARAAMEELYARVADLGYVLLLADADGITLDYLGHRLGDSPLRAGLVVGANWHEEQAGTNGIGTCLAECRTLTCHYDDHYYAGNLDLSCTATPLFDPEGELMGVLDLSSLTTPHSRTSQHLIGHMASMYGRLIEDANFLRHFGHRWVLRIGRAASLVEVNAEALLAFDADGVIVGANSGARRLLQTVDGQGAAALPGQPLSAVFRNPLGDIWRLARSANSDGSVLLHPWLGEPRQAMVRGPQRRARLSGAASAQADRLQPAPQGDMSVLEALADGDPKMDALISQARRLAGRSINMIIQGETGTGKEVLAQAIHKASPRTERAFVAINCAAIPESLIESELFGYLPGTFTGARSRGMVGLIQRSDGGTLFLDEIGDMPLALQTRLLRVLAERELLPLGADKPIPLALTVIAASHRNLRERIADGHFREDLYYRLSGATLSLPPLRERRDRAYLIRRILSEETAAIDTGGRLTVQAMELLLRYPWPGNIRELRNVLRFALSMAEGGDVGVCDLPLEVQQLDATGVAALADAQAACAVDAGRSVAGADGDASPEVRQLLDALRRHHWVIAEVARELTMCRATVYRRMKRYGIVAPTQFC